MVSDKEKRKKIKRDFLREEFPSATYVPVWQDVFWSLVVGAIALGTFVVVLWIIFTTFLILM